MASGDHQNPSRQCLDLQGNAHIRHTLSKATLQPVLYSVFSRTAAASEIDRCTAASVTVLVMEDIARSGFPDAASATPATNFSCSSN